MVLTLLGVLVEGMELDAFFAALCVASVECWRFAAQYADMVPLEAHLPEPAAQALRRCAEGAGSDGRSSASSRAAKASSRFARRRAFFRFAAKFASSTERRSSASRFAGPV